MTRTVLLTEVVHQVDESKLCQNVGNNLTARVLGLIQVHVEISHQYGVLALEALHGLLYVEKVSQRGWW